MTGQDYMGMSRQKVPWFPLIDAEKCTNCGLCLDFCSNNVFKAGELATTVANPYNCVVGCSSCQRICSSDAITFPSNDELIQWLKELRENK